MNNPYILALILPLIGFLSLIVLKVNPDWISLIARIYAFVVLGYVGARYVGRAPVLVWERDTSQEARNVVGWGVAIVGFMLQIAYGWIYIAYDRPDWLASQYWSASIVVLVSVGLTIVATSVPRFPPFGDGRNGLSEVASLVVVVSSALAVFFASHLPQVWAVIKGLWSGLLRVV